MMWFVVDCLFIRLFLTFVVYLCFYLLRNLLFLWFGLVFLLFAWLFVGLLPCAFARCCVIVCVLCFACFCL